MKPEISLPWKTDSRTHIYRDEDTYVADTFLAQDAAYIVHACNNFPRLEAERAELVAALRMCLVAFSEVEPKPEDYEAVNSAALLLAKLGEG